MDKGRPLIRLALFGQPIQSSLSPAIHRLFARQCALAIDYQRVETGADGFTGALEAFRAGGGVGCSVTLPLKRLAWRLAAGSSAEAAQARAANTLVLQSPAGWFAHNTDGAGLVADLAGNHGIGLAGQRILLLGAGGAAAGILGSLLAEGPREVVVVNRDPERGRRLVKRFEASGEVGFADWSGLPGAGEYDLLINATALGHAGEAPPLVPSLFAPGSLCYDLNYHQAGAPLRALCGALGQRYVDGLGMLVEQAARSFYIWTGRRPDSAEVIASCRREFP